MVDNGSTDGSVAAVRVHFPMVTVIALRANAGAAGRNVAARLCRTPYLAFCDDDSWWAPGALDTAVAVLDAHPSVAVLVGQVLVGPDERADPVCELLAHSPLETPEGAPGPLVLGFPACGAIVRKSAFLEVGGFHPRFGVGGEEELLALDLMALDWQVVYVREVVAHHHPATGGRSDRRGIQVRNALWSSWLRRSPLAAGRSTIEVMGRARRDRSAARGIARAASGLPWVLRERRRLPAEVEQAKAATG
jgi:GT2 family glycosyltransferase